MVSLVDIGPLTETVPFRGHSIEVTGISAETVFAMLRDIPELRLLFAGKAVNGDLVQVLIAQAPRAVAAMIAAAMGKLDDEAEIEAAMKMSAGETALFLQPIVKMTFPQGVKVFIDGLTAIVDEAAGPGWVRDMKSPAQSKSASKTDIPSS